MVVRILENWTTHKSFVGVYTALAILMGSTSIYYKIIYIYTLCTYISYLAVHITDGVIKAKYTEVGGVERDLYVPKWRLYK